ncbi:hypothetical protein IHV10_06490 [Fictibacillus sp. 5RED26]|uniref:hypothetical protein n=1 Tax=Fictibacillus sp. 5RED26 TaxID=2745876 RepID=UPI0018CD1F7E|nr:hypothetical protein [Fictibacillus sp. 5RED26]MBH0156011.1 hypothetical protein [Fictibacillus sp. 5RED26]
MSRVSKWRKYVDEKLAYRDMKEPLEKALGRKLTKDEYVSILCLSDSGWLTVGTLVGMFEELANKNQFETGGIKMMKKYTVMGNVSFDVQLEVNSESHEEAVMKAETLINSYNVIMRELQLLTMSSDYIKVKLNDVEVDWQTASDEEE